MADYFLPTIKYPENRANILRPGRPNNTPFYDFPGFETVGQIAADGTKYALRVGDRRIYSVTFTYLTESKIDEFATFYNTVGQDRAWFYYEDGTFHRAGDAGLTAGSAPKIGTLKSGNEDDVKMYKMTLEADPRLDYQAHRLWSITLNMRVQARYINGVLQ